MTDYLRTDPDMERKLLEYILATSSQSSVWWSETLPGTTETRRSRLDRFRLRYEARRSVAALFTDLKTQPFLRASNVGVGLEQIFGEWLIANCLANTVDLDPPIDVFDPTTRKTDEAVEQFYRHQYLNQLSIRTVYEVLLREVFMAGSAISKWESYTNSRQREREMWVLLDPLTKQPILFPSESGSLEPIPADPQMPPEQLPMTPSGPALVGRITSVENVSTGWQPRLRVRTVEQIDVPPTAITQDPNEWDYLHETYTVNAWWFLTRQGEMIHGKIPKERLAMLWQRLGVTPEEAWRRPNGQLVRPVVVRESHMRFPATKSGQPVELVVLSLPELKFILTWRLTPFARRPYFNHQVWHRTNHWMGKGIPETLFGLRNAIDALLNQDLDAGNLYNQPPLLISSLAGLNDETFEMAGPGAVWYMRDINGMKFLPPPIRSRDPLAMLNWLVSMAQRVWGVTDLNLNAPSASLSPNIRTATGVTQVTQQANIKFGHFIRAIEAVRTPELRMLHQLFGDLWTGEYVASGADGQPVKITRERLLPHLELRAPGDGIQSNPILRQQRLVELAGLYAETQNPSVVADPEVMFDLASQLNDGAGISLPIKPPQEVAQMRLAAQLMQTMTMQSVLPQAMQELQAMLAQAAAQQAQPNGNGRGRPHALVG